MFEQPPIESEDSFDGQNEQLNETYETYEHFAESAAERIRQAQENAALLESLSQRTGEPVVTHAEEIERLNRLVREHLSETD